MAREDEYDYLFKGKFFDGYEIEKKVFSGLFSGAYW